MPFTGTSFVGAGIATVSGKLLPARYIPRAHKVFRNPNETRAGRGALTFGISVTTPPPGSFSALHSPSHSAAKPVHPATTAEIMSKDPARRTHYPGERTAPCRCMGGRGLHLFIEALRYSGVGKWV